MESGVFVPSQKILVVNYNNQNNKKQKMVLFLINSLDAFKLHHIKTKENLAFSLRSLNWIS